MTVIHYVGSGHFTEPDQTVTVKLVVLTGSTPCDDAETRMTRRNSLIWVKTPEAQNPSRVSRAQCLQNLVPLPPYVKI